MKLLPAIAFFFFLVNTSNQNLLKVSIFYESLSSDSIKFITEQLYPCYQTLKKYIFVDFVPYGKVDIAFKNGTFVYECQHGKEECYGNRMQACGLALSQNQNTSVEFVNCIMSMQNPALSSTIYECAVTTDLSWDDIENCEKCIDGKRLFTYHGRRTHFIVPNITFVPTIVYNDRYIEKIHKEAYADFCGTTLKIIKYLISTHYPFPSCMCSDLSPAFPMQCCGYNTWGGGCSWCNLYNGGGGYFDG